MKPYTAKDLDFIKYVKSRCKEHGVKCFLSNTKSVKLQEGVRCSGYFDETVPILASSMNREDWKEILAHEYCHLTQWVEQIPLWVQAETSLSFVWEWLDGSEECYNIDYHIGVARDLELDNEKRVVKLIKSFGLNIDIETYTQKANSYVMFYNWLKQTRKWCNKNNSPYSNMNIRNSMSTKFNMDYSKLSKKAEALFRKENI